MSAQPIDLTGIQFHGNLNTLTSDLGTLVTDRYLLDTCTAAYSIRKDMWQQLPSVGAFHPMFSWIQMERRELSFSGVWASAKCSYAGVIKDTTPIYELSDGLSQEPISTHPQFTSFAGNAASPLNGAIFKYIGGGTQLPPADAKNPATNQGAGYVFDHFQTLNDDGSLNKYAGMEDYLEAGQMTWRVTINVVGNVQSFDISRAGKIDQPAGNAPSLGGSRNWLNMGYTMTQRGAATQVVTEWKASGRRGWNTEVYT